MYTDTQEVCRLCLAKAGHKPTHCLKSIFSLRFKWMKTIRTILKIKRYETVSTLICFRCVKKIRYINIFMVKCEEANNVLCGRTIPDVRDEPSLEKVNEITSKINIFDIDIEEHEVKVENTSDDKVKVENTSDDKIKVENTSDDKAVDAKGLKSDEENDFFDNCAADGDDDAELSSKQVETSDIEENWNANFASDDGAESITSIEDLYKENIVKEVKVKKINTKKRDKIKKTKHKKKKYNRTHLCDICGRYFLSFGPFLRHLDKHQNITYQCDICSKTFDNKWDLKRNMMEHARKNPFYACKLCDKKFKAKRTLNLHVKVTHIKAKPDVICSICGREFYTMEYLKVHMKVHSTVHSLQCDICLKTFVRKNFLKKHLKTHSDKRPFKCKYCPKAFKFTEHRKKHERLHTGETPHKCPVCAKAFAQKCNMKSHFVHNHKKLDFNETMKEFENKLKSQEEATDIKKRKLK